MGTKRKKRPPIEGWMGAPGRRWLRARARTHSAIIEVGVWKGRSTHVIAKATRGKVWAVDHWRGTPQDPEQHERLYAAAVAEAGPNAVFREFRRNLAPWIAVHRVVPVRADSVAAAALLLERYGRFADWIFIDADHSYEGCAGDIRAFRPLLIPGGLLSGHDYAENWPGVRRAVDELAAEVGPVTLGPSTIWSVVP